MAPFKGQDQRSRLYYNESKMSTKPLFFSSFYQINFKLGVKVARDLLLSGLIFGAK
jgi:hypothetical protein